MSVQLQELYNGLDDRDELILIAGQQGMDHPVRWVHMVEGIDITLFLEGDEVAFTTGIALGSPEDLTALVKCTQERGAAAMVINVGPYIPEIPQEVIDFGNEAGFPIFRVPWRVHMANIMREFALQITRQETIEMEIETAFENAIAQPENTKLYLPTILEHGYQKEWPYCIALLRLSHEKHEGRRSIEQKNTKDGQVTDSSKQPDDVRVVDAAGTQNKGNELTEEQMERYCTYAQRDFYTRDKNTVVYRKEKYLVLIFANASDLSAAYSDAGAPELQVKQQIQVYLANLRKYFDSGIRACVGIGDTVDGVSHIAESYAQAKYAFDLNSQGILGSELDIQRQVQHRSDFGEEIAVFREMGIYRLLFSTDRQAAEEYYQEVLGPLAAHDRANGTDDLYFLREYFAHDCSVQEMAALFHLHRNSVAYRLGKVEEIIGMSLHSNDSRAKVILAFRIETAFGMCEK